MIIKKGDKGLKVMAVQQVLGINADGIFGPATEAAVKDFQRKNGLVADGIVGDKTLAAMNLISEKNDNKKY
ncbi:MAG: peptidoglycan-binding domain-containing protein, partial [Bacteroidaceae bacterium]|nr:peptidoglycan-binding domain-containing protein [Bacteroidaceae bacterium]